MRGATPVGESARAVLAVGAGTSSRQVKMRADGSRRRAVDAMLRLPSRRVCCVPHRTFFSFCLLFSEAALPTVAIIAQFRREVASPTPKRDGLGVTISRACGAGRRPEPSSNNGLDCLVCVCVGVPEGRVQSW